MWTPEQEIFIQELERETKATLSNYGITADVYIVKPDRIPVQMVDVVTDALNLEKKVYTLKSRERDIVELRFICALLMKKYMPRVTLSQIARIFGGMNHTSIINAREQGNNLLETQEPVFTEKYQIAEKAVLQWLKA